MKKFFSFLIIIFLLASSLCTVKAKTTSPSSITITNKVTDTLKYFDPKPTISSRY